MTRRTTPCLNTEIQVAADSTEVHRLLAKGAGFESVSSKTRNRWNRTAKRRLAELKEAK